jgi:hypothetical protein
MIASARRILLFDVSGGVIRQHSGMSWQDELKRDVGRYPTVLKKKFFRTLERDHFGAGNAGRLFSPSIVVQTARYTRHLYPARGAIAQKEREMLVKCLSLLKKRSTRLC